MSKPRTPAQNDRAKARSESGKFVKNPCDLCGRGCPMRAYFSANRDGLDCGCFGLVVHERCAEKLEAMTDEEFKAAYEMRTIRNAGGAA